MTDANLLLGRLPADQFLGGDFQLDPPRTQKIVAQWLKDNGSQLTPEEFAAFLSAEHDKCGKLIKSVGELSPTRDGL